LPFIIPSLLVCLGFARFFGNAGIINAALSAIGLKPIPFLYGFWGIILVHTFYNIPLAGRFVSDSLTKSDPHLEESACLLGAGPLRRFISITLPEAMPGLLAVFPLIFLYCFQSFSVVLLLGGGPRFSTLELEIYQAFKFSFQYGRATALTLFGLLTGILALSLHLRFSRVKTFAITSPESFEKRRRLPPLGLAFAGLYAALLALFIGGPIISLIASSLSARLSRAGGAAFSLSQYRSLFFSASSLEFLRALGNSLLLGLCAGLVSALLALACVEILRKNPQSDLVYSASVFPLAVSPVILAQAYSFLAKTALDFPLLAFYQGIVALPLATQTLYARYQKIPRSYEEAARSLGASGLKAFLTVRFPLSRRAAFAAAAFSFSLSQGDVTGVLMFNIPNFETLSLYIYRLSGAYRFEMASAAGIILLALCAGSFFIAEKSA
jgi:thiamine transport system permease protein